MLLNFLLKIAKLCTVVKQTKYKVTTVFFMKLGQKIRNLRLQCGLTQEELADRSELTKGYISQLENELTSPSIATLTDILSALGSSLQEFFADFKDEKVVFTDRDFIEKDTKEYKLSWLVPNSQKNLMEPIRMELNPGCSAEEDFPHEGEEFGYVLQGEICIKLGNVVKKCKKGDSFYFTTDKPHTIYNKKDVKAVFIWISSPPNF